MFTESGYQKMNQPTLKPAVSLNGDKQVIYVVDDETVLLVLVSVILGPLGYTIRTFQDPESALEAFASAQPQPVLIVTDYAMNTMNGLEFIAACRRIQPQQKVLMLSGSVGRDVCENAASRPNHYLAKPYQPKQLIEAVKLALGQNP